MNDELKNRIIKRFKFLKKWANREKITCFRIYERDLSNYPLTIDWIDGDVVVWLYQRRVDDTAEKQESFRIHCLTSIRDALDLKTEKLYIKERGIQKGNVQYTKIKEKNKQKIVLESNLKFELNLSDYLDVGLFLDHRKTRNLIRQMSDGKRVLNLFAYTGSFTCYAVDGGAKFTLTLDMNVNYCRWIERNMKLNGIEISSQNQVLALDCISYLNDQKNKDKFDIIIFDPPTFSNSKKMKKSFSIDSDYVELLKLCLRKLNRNGVIMFSNNSKSFKFDISLFDETVSIREITAKTISEDFIGKISHRSWLIEKK